MELSSSKKSIISLGRKDSLLESIFLNTFDAIFVTDKDGMVIAANPASMQLLDISYDELIGNKVQELISKGVYNYSTALQATELRTVITGVVTSSSGVEMMSTSSPIFGEDGEIEMVITTSRAINSLEKFWHTFVRDREGNPKHFTLEEKTEPKNFVYESSIMKEMLRRANRVAKTDISVMICGETGVGKGVLASYIHNKSLRADQPFIEVNCAAIPESLMESEFFGYEKGAFTGANTRGKLGLFELASGGTIFLDEIGEMPLHLQGKLLKVLDSSLIRRVGGTVYQKVNVRIIAATNTNLTDQVVCGKFRADLYYRLNVISMTLPPLRARVEDIKLIAKNHLASLNQKYNYNKSFSPRVLDFLASYSWPGNIRQLKNIVERLVIMHPDDLIDSTSIEDVLDFNDAGYHLPKESESNMLAETLNSDDTLQNTLDAVRFLCVKNALRKHHGNVTQAAKQLGVHRTTVYKIMQNGETPSDPDQI